MDVEKKHIQSVIDLPHAFNLSITDIQNTYLYKREELGFEGDAQKKIILDLIKQGYIHISYYPEESTWTIIVINIDLKTIDVLHLWAKMVLIIKIFHFSYFYKFISINLSIFNIL